MLHNKIKIKIQMWYFYTISIEKALRSIK